MAETTITSAPAPRADVVERPIAFSPEMVSALLAGRKSQTRRLVRWPKEFGGAQPHPDRLDNVGDCVSVYATDPRGKNYAVTCPYGEEGDRLWVREPFRFLNPDWDGFSPSEVVATWGGAVPAVTIYTPFASADRIGRYRHARFMPRALARLLLDVTAWPDLQRLEDVTEEDAIAEGIMLVDTGPGPLRFGLPTWPRFDRQPTAREAYLKLFRSINGIIGDANPWVWVVYAKPRA